MRSLITTIFLLALLNTAACAQDATGSPNKPVAAKQETRKATPAPTPRLPPDLNKYAVIISGIGGEDEYLTRFAKWTADLRSGLVERLGFAENHVIALTEKPAENEQPCTADAVRDSFARLHSIVKPDNQVFIFFIGHGSLQCSNGGGNLRSGNDATGARSLADDGHHLTAMWLEHDQVCCCAGFEFVEHVNALWVQWTRALGV